MKNHRRPQPSLLAHVAQSATPQCLGSNCPNIVRCSVGQLPTSCKLRILIVGGIERMESRYRQLIEQLGGEMEYHHGHLNGGSIKLENSLRRCDLVLCPVNCNSHAACNAVKALGKKHRKPTFMLPNFSLSAISQIVTSIQPVSLVH